VHLPALCILLFFVSLCYRAISVTFLMFPSLRRPTIRSSKSIKVGELAISPAFREHRRDKTSYGLRLREEDATNEFRYIVIDDVCLLCHSWIGKFIVNPLNLIGRYSYSQSNRDRESEEMYCNSNLHLESSKIYSAM